MRLIIVYILGLFTGILVSDSAIALAHALRLAFERSFG